MEEWQAWCKVSTCHGLADHQRSNSLIGKCCWLLLVFIFFGFSLSSVGLVIVGYTQGSKWTTKVYYEQTNAMSWPDITICNLNRANKTKLEEIGLEVIALPYLFETLPNYYTFQLQNDPELFNQSRAAYHRFRNRTPTLPINELFRDIGHQCDQTIAKCGTMSGSLYPQRFVLNTHIDEYVDIVQNNHLDQGLVLVVSLDQQYYISGDSFATLSPGSHVFIELKPVKNRIDKGTFLPAFVPPPCRLPEEQNFSIINAGSYSKTACFSECTAQLLIDKCNCLLITDNDTPLFPNNFQKCDPDIMAQCGVQALYFSENSNHSHCLSQCVSECIADFVHIKQKRIKFPAKKLIPNAVKELVKYGLVNSKMKNNETFRKTFSKNMIMADIYYTDFGWFVYEYTQTMTFESITGTIGGSLGLYLGCSILTIVQMIVYLLGCVWSFFIRFVEPPDRPDHPPVDRIRQRHSSSANVSAGYILAYESKDTIRQIKF